MRAAVMLMAGMLAACGGAPPLPARQCALTEHQFRLPFPDGTAFRVVQGNHGSFSHTGLDTFAWDFAMPVGTPVVATEDGVVAEVQVSFTAGGPDPELAERANVVVIDHGDAHFSVYQHLMPGGALVREGDVVAQGQVIGQSGNTGYSTEPHLHFEVIDHRNRSQPVCFEGVKVPREPRRYTAHPPHHHTALPVRPSVLPADVFRDNGVILTSPVPARRLAQEVPLVVEGLALHKSMRAVVFLLPRDGGGTLRHAYGDVVEDGTFRVVMDLAGLEGPYGMAVALVSGTGRFSTRFSVPVVVRADPSAPPRPSAGVRTRCLAHY